MMSLDDYNNDYSSILDSSNDGNKSTNQLNHNNNNNNVNNIDSNYRQLFNIFDIEKSGFISVENFVNILNENLPDEENKISEIVNTLDPFGIGQIDYYQFVEGISKLMTDKNEADEFYSRSRTGTFSSLINETNSRESETPTKLTSPRNLPRQARLENYGEEIYEDSPESNNFNSHTDPGSEDEEKETDSFGLSNLDLSNHRRSLASGASVYQNKRLSRKFMSLQHTISHEQSEVKDYEFLTESNEKHEETIGNLELKIKELENENRSLKYQLHGTFEINEKLKIENAHLNDKIRESEERDVLIEEKFRLEMDDEKSRHQEELNKVYTNYSDDREKLLKTINQLETKLNESRGELTNFSKEINEKNKVIESREEKIHDLEMRGESLVREIQLTLKKCDMLKKEIDEQKQNYEEKIEILNAELEESKNKLDEFSFPTQNFQQQRKNTLYDENYLQNQIKHLEDENKQLKTQNEQLKSNNEALNAEKLQRNLERGKPIAQLSISTKEDESLASEIVKESKEELVEKLNCEMKMSERLREYINELTTKILEHNPEILNTTKPKNTNTKTTSSPATIPTPTTTTTANKKKPSESSTTIFFRRQSTINK